MTRRALPLLALILCLPLARVDSAGVASKQLLVTVVADEKQPVQDLSAADFVVREDRAQREVTGAVLATEPVSVALLVDTSQPASGATIPTITRDLRQSLLTFVKTIQSAGADARIAYWEVGGAAINRVPFTAKRGELEPVLERLYPDTRRTAVMIEALTDAGSKLSQMPAPRRTIVTVDLNSPEDSREAEQKSAIETVDKSGATVWAVSIGSGARNTRDNVLNILTKESGGQRQTIIDTSSLEARLKGVAHTVLSQYHLTYVRPDNVAAVKDIQIETKRGLKAFRTRWIR